MAHSYPFSVRWHGSTADPAYSPDAQALAPGKPGIPVSSAPEFRGNPVRWNPEDLLVAALSECHLLSYLHACVTAGVVVTSYRDEATGIMREDGRGSGAFAEVK